MELRVKLYVPREESFLFPMKYINVTRNIHASLDILLENRLKCTGTCMEKKNYRMNGQDSQDLLYRRKGHQKDTHGPGRDEVDEWRCRSSWWWSS